MEEMVYEKVDFRQLSGPDQLVAIIDEQQGRSREVSCLDWLVGLDSVGVGFSLFEHDDVHGKGYRRIKRPDFENELRIATKEILAMTNLKVTSGDKWRQNLTKDILWIDVYQSYQVSARDRGKALLNAFVVVSVVREFQLVRRPEWRAPIIVWENKGSVPEGACSLEKAITEVQEGGLDGKSIEVAKTVLNKLARDYASREDVSRCSADTPASRCDRGSATGEIRLSAEVNHVIREKVDFSDLGGPDDLAAILHEQQVRFYETNCLDWLVALERVGIGCLLAEQAAINRNGFGPINRPALESGLRAEAAEIIGKTDLRIASANEWQKSASRDTVGMRVSQLYRVLDEEPRKASLYVCVTVSLFEEFQLVREPEGHAPLVVWQQELEYPEGTNSWQRSASRVRQGQLDEQSIELAKSILKALVRDYVSANA